MLTKPELDQMNARMEANANDIISKGFARPKRKDAIILENTLQESLSIIYNYCYLTEQRYPSWLDDLVTGASRMNMNSTKSLNRGSILKVLGSLTEISTASIAWKLKVNERTAREYFSCIRVIYPKLSAHIPDELKLIDNDVGGLFD